MSLTVSIEKLAGRLLADEETRLNETADQAAKEARAAYLAMAPEPDEAPKMRAKLSQLGAKRAKMLADIAAVDAERAQVEGTLNSLTYQHSRIRNDLHIRSTAPWRLRRAYVRLGDAIEAAQKNPEYLGIPEILAALFVGQNRLGNLRDGLHEGLEDPDVIVDEAIAASLAAYEKGEPIRRARIEARERERRATKLFNPVA